MSLPKAFTPVSGAAFILERERFSRALLVILALALAIRVWGTWFGQPFVLHPDEHIIAQKALDMFKDPAYDLNPHFFEYPSLYIYITAFLYLIFGLVLMACGSIESLPQLYDYAVQNIFYFHFGGRLLTATLGAATVYLTYLATRRLWGRTAALAAAWFLTFAYVHFTDSHFLATDVPSAFGVMLAFSICAAALRTKRRGLLYWAGFASGLAASMKYPAGLILLTVFVAYFFRQRWRGATLRQMIFSDIPLKISLSAGAGFLAGTPYAVLDFKNFAGGLLRQLFHSKLGHLGLAESGFFGYFTAIVPSGGVGKTLVIAVLAGMLFSFLRPRSYDWMLFSFPVFFYLLLGKSALKVDRYLIPVIPIWCIYAGIFVARASQLFDRLRLPARLVAPVLALIFSVPSLYGAAKWCWIAAQPDTRLQAAAWMRANIAKESILAMHSGAWMLPPVPPDRFRIAPMKLFTEESAKKHLSLKLALLDNPVSAWILSRVLDYRLEASARDSLRAMLRNMPDFATWRARPLAYYREQNVDFVITSSLIKERFLDAATIARYPAMAGSWQAFYRELEQSGRLVKEFVPPVSYHHRWGMGFLESPTICIYGIRDGAAVRTGGAP